MALAGEVQAALSDDSYEDFLRQMYGNEPARWSDALTGAERLRVVVNALTRLRFCTPDGTMDFTAKEGLDAAPPGFWPWFEVPGRRTEDTLMAFGHWSTLGFMNRPNLISLDTGCVWGGCLSALRLGRGGRERELVQVECEQAQKP
jgi:bis(5'-nucleosyl)-tetraphosphatase (symmetrical)